MAEMLNTKTNSSCRLLAISALLFATSNVLGQTISGTPLPPLSSVPEVKAATDGTIPSEVSVNKGKVESFKMTIGGGSSSDEGNKQAVQIVPKIPNSVAVTDLSIKKEVKEFFYDEKFNSKASIQSSPSTPVVSDGSSIPSPTQSQTINGQAETSYSKQFGTRRVISYSEVRGLNADIKSTLIKAGYKVVQAAPNVAKENENDNFFNVSERINRGDFRDAQFVLHGTITNVEVRNTRDFIQGTADYSYRLEHSLIVEFSLINTETLQVIASFNAMGSGQDMYLGKNNAIFVPKVDRITRELLSSFSQDAHKKLMDQLPPINKETSILNVFSSKQETGVGDPSTLKVYAPGKAGGGSQITPDKDSVIIYRK
jgi:hypothetical protein